MNIRCASGIWTWGKRVSGATVGCLVDAGVMGCTSTHHNSSSSPALPAQGCAIQAQAEVTPETSADGVRAWSLMFSAETNAKLEGMEVLDSDGIPHQNLRALDCLVDAVVEARELCTCLWQHDSDISTELPDGRLVSRIYCVNEHRV